MITIITTTEGTITTTEDIPNTDGTTGTMTNIETIEMTDVGTTVKNV